MNRSLDHVLIPGSLAGAILLLLSPAAEAYVGPGAGLSLLGALWALIVAIGAAVAFIVAWPIRRMRRRKREERELAAANERSEDSAAPSTDTSPSTDAGDRRPPPAPAQEATEPRRP
jgi:hypothetical protein